jgi:hypothetical protein
MEKIWKYTIKDRRSSFRMPTGAKILTVQLQDKEAVLWAIVETLNQMEDRIIIAVQTDSYVPTSSKYIGTVQFYNGYVEHFFDSSMNIEETQEVTGVI